MKIKSSGLKRAFQPRPTLPMDLRLQAHLDLEEILTAILSVCLLVTCLVLHAWRNHIPYDYYNYIQTAQGNFTHFYYAYYLLPLFQLLNWMPLYWGYFVWGLLSIYGVFFSVRVFGGQPWMAMLSFQLFYTLYFGQITGVILAGLAMLWWGMAQRRWYLAGLGMLLAVSKYQLGIPSSLLLWFMAKAPWKDRWRVFIIPTGGLIFSLFLNPLWPLESWLTIFNSPPNDYGNISLWRWLGPLTLLFWIPPLLIRIPPEQRVKLLITTAVLTVPYFQQNDLLLLHVFPIGWLLLLNNLGLPLLLLGWDALKWLIAAPLVLYLVLLLKSIIYYRKIE